MKIRNGFVSNSSSSSFVLISNKVETDKVIVKSEFSKYWKAFLDRFAQVENLSGTDVYLVGYFINMDYHEWEDADFDFDCEAPPSTDKWELRHNPDTKVGYRDILDALCVMVPKEHRTSFSLGG